MKVITRKISTLNPSEDNPRQHPPSQIEALAKSIMRFGFTIPILIDENSMVLAGHGRLEAAKTAGLDKVPCLRADGWSDEEKKAYIIADNRLADQSTWDAPLLFDLASSLDEDLLGLTGFSPDELELYNPDAAGEDLFGGEGQSERKKKSKTDDGYVEFSVVMETANKARLIEAINAAKKEHALETIEEGLMALAHGWVDE